MKNNRLKMSLVLSISFVLSVIYVFNISIDNPNLIYNKQKNTNRYSSQSFAKRIRTTENNVSVKSVWSEKKQRVKGVLKSDQPDMFAQIKQMIRIRDGETEHGYEKNYRFKEFHKAKARVRLLKSSSNKVMDLLPWEERGPANVGGRTRGIIVDPDDASLATWYVGSVGGGIWKTTNSGQNWIPLTDDMPNLATVCLEMSASNRDVLYAGTGEGFYNVDAVEGDGMFKSTDRGESWTQLASTVSNEDFAYVNRLVIDPNDENIVIAATNAGIFKTTDGGVTWDKKFSGLRVQHIIANPQNFNTLYATENGKGLVKSFDAGDTWTSTFGGDLAGSRFEIALAPTDTSRLYLSAEGGNSIFYASTDAGSNWFQVDEQDGSDIRWLGAQGWYDNTIAVHPFDENIVFIGGIDVWKSEIVLDSAVGITNLIEVGIDTLFSYSQKGLELKDGGVGTGGVFWDEKVAADEDYVPVEIRFGPGKLQKAHRFINNDYTYKDYVDVPFEVWDVINNKQLMVSFFDLQKNGVFNLLASRGDIIFVNSVDYDPVNPSSNIAIDDGAKFKNLFVVAFRNALGKTWDPDNLPDATIGIEIGFMPVILKNTIPISDGYNQYDGVQADIHVDHHNLIMIPIDEATNNFRILNASDGGIAISYDGGDTFTEVGDNGYNTTQFYGVDKKPLESEYMGGTQDNGTFQSPWGVSSSETSSYDHRIGGDGFEVAWHYSDPNKMLGGSQYNRFVRTTDGWQTSEAANIGFPDWGNSANSPFISKIAESNSDPDLIFTITRQGVFRSDNFAASWDLIPIDSDFQTGGYFSLAQVAISIADPQVVWAGAYLGGDGKMHVSTDGGITFSATNNFSGGVMGRVSGFDTHPTDPSTAYAIFSFADAPKILRTTNYGSSWEDISGFTLGSTVGTKGFPNVAVYSLAVMPYDANILWAGTDIGIVESIDGGDSWHLADNGLPAVSVWDIKIVDDEVVLATHGRGIWSVKLPGLSGYTPPIVTLSPRLNGAYQNPSGVILDIGLRSIYDSTQVFIDNQISWTLFNQSVKDTILIVSVTDPGEITVFLKSYKDGREFKSTNKVVEVFELLATQLGYSNNFDTSADELFFDGFEVKEVIGFSSPAVHTPHPYPDQIERIMMLRVPIVVAESNALLVYDDVAIIESGDPGSVFGDNDFWDYAIVEASKGGEWIPLESGYDARANSQWLDAYNNSQNGTSSMFVNHSLNLLDFFSTGDTILIRFRLFADQFTTGWGWVIDNLSIQDQFVGIGDGVKIPTNFELSQNYPNPFNPVTTIKFSLPSESNVKIRVYNSLGQLISVLINQDMNAGFHQVTWDGANLASGIYFYNIEAIAADGSKDFFMTKKMLLLK